MNNRADRDRDQMMRALDRITAFVAVVKGGYPELHRRDEQQTGPDGYPTSTGGSSESTIATRNTSRSTESAGLRLAERGVDPDAIHYSHQHLRAMIYEMDRLGASAASHVVNALTLGDTARGRTSTITECANPRCARTIAGTERDRPRAGRCEPCYRYWREHDRDRDPGNAADQSPPA